MFTPAIGNSHKPYQQSQATSMSVPAIILDRELVRTLAVQVVNHCSTSRFGAAHSGPLEKAINQTTVLALLQRGFCNSSSNIFTISLSQAFYCSCVFFLCLSIKVHLRTPPHSLQIKTLTHSKSLKNTIFIATQSILNNYFFTTVFETLKRKKKKK
jgi:hypothetical protein